MCVWVMSSGSRLGDNAFLHPSLWLLHVQDIDRQLLRPERPVS